MKKISDFGDGGGVQTGDKFLIARSGSNYAIDGSVIANTVANVATLQSGQLTLSANVANAADTVAALRANVTLNSSAITMLQANMASDGAAITALQSNVALLQANDTGSSGTGGSGSDQTANVVALQSNVTSLQGNVAGLTARVTTLETSGGSGGSTGGTGSGGSGGSGSTGGSSGGVSLPSKTWWRIRFQAAQAQGTVGVDDIVLAGVDGGPSLTQGGTAFSSADYSASYPAAQAFDGTSARWYGPTGTCLNEYVGYTFGSAVNVQEIRITVTDTAYGPRWFCLDFSEDGRTWTQVNLYVAADWGVAPTQGWQVKYN